MNVAHPWAEMDEARAELEEAIEEGASDFEKGDHVEARMNLHALCALLLVAILGLGCWNRDAPGKAKADAEAAAARRAIAAGLHAGSSEAELRAFCSRQGWHFGFDTEMTRSRARVYTAPGNSYAVIVFLDVNEKRELVRSEVKIYETSL